MPDTPKTPDERRAQINSNRRIADRRKSARRSFRCPYDEMQCEWRGGACLEKDDSCRRLNSRGPDGGRMPR